MICVPAEEGGTDEVTNSICLKITLYSLEVLSQSPYSLAGVLGALQPWVWDRLPGVGSGLLHWLRLLPWVMCGLHEYA